MCSLAHFRSNVNGGWDSALLSAERNDMVTQVSFGILVTGLLMVVVTYLLALNQTSQARAEGLRFELGEATS